MTTLWMVAGAYILGSLITYYHCHKVNNINKEFLDKYNKLEKERNDLIKTLNRYTKDVDKEVVKIIINYYESVLKGMKQISDEFETEGR